jgi:hypothetical protein
MQDDPTKHLYFDDLHVGQQFTSGTHLVDEKEIKAFARLCDVAAIEGRR